jgi:hypothetical protein
MPTDTLITLISQARSRLTDLLATGAPTRDTALFLADLEEEQMRRTRVDEQLRARADALATPRSRASDRSEVLDRPLPTGLDGRAGTPRTHRTPTDDERARGVVIAYASANLTFYRAVNDRLMPGEKLRMETQHGTFEMTRDQFEAAMPAPARSPSYQHGSASTPGKARYVTGHVPRSLQPYRVN